MTDCLKILNEAAGGKIPSDKLAEMIAELKAEKEARIAEGKIAGLDQAIRDRAGKMAEYEMLAAQREQYRSYKNVLVRRELWSRVNEADNKFGDPSLGLQSALGGVNAPLESGRLSVDAINGGLFGKYSGGLVYDLRKADLLTSFKNMDGEFEIQVAEAMSNMSRKVPIPTKAGKEATDLAKILYKWKKAAFDEINREGAFIPERQGHVARQRHSQPILAIKGPEKWKEAIRDKLDFDKMGVLPQEREGFLDAVYKAFISGYRLDEIGGLNRTEAQAIEDMLKGSFKGPGNIARRISEARVLEFKSIRDQRLYDREFGAGSLRDAIVEDLRSMARNTALMKVLGHNPESMFKAVKDEMMVKFAGDTKKTDKIEGGIINLNHLLDEVTGKVNITETRLGSRVASVSAAWRLIQTMSKLGGSVISALSDPGMSSTNRMFQGAGMVEAWADAFSAPWKGLTGKARREVAERIGSGTTGVLGSILARTNPTDNFSGRMGKFAQLYFKLNLLGPWTEGGQRGMTMIFSHDLARNAGKELSKLSPDMQRVLKIYGIKDREWNVARLAIKKADDGLEYIMPGDIADVKGAPFTGLSEVQQQKLRDDVQTKLYTMLNAESRTGIVEPGANERAILRRGTRPGTSFGELARSLGLFKSFGVSAISKVIGRQVYGRGATSLGDFLMHGEGRMGLVNLIAGTTILGMFSYQAKAIYKGQNPSPVDTPKDAAKLFLTGFLQGGGAGIYGDFMFQETNRFGGGKLATIAGPAITEPIRAMEIVNQAMYGKKFAGDTVKLLRANTPAVNLFYTKQAMDYLIWFQMMEFVNPGYLRRYEKTVKRNTGRGYWLPPSSVVKTGGGFQ